MLQWMCASVSVCIIGHVHQWVCASVDVCISECVHPWMCASVDEFMISHGAKSLHTSKASSTRETLTHYQVQLPAQSTALAPSGPQLLCTNPEKTFPRRSTLSDAGLLITTDSSSPPDQHQLSRQSKVFTLVVLNSKYHIHGLRSIFVPL
jgi:hypothetical protein